MPIWIAALFLVGMICGFTGFAGVIVYAWLAFAEEDRMLAEVEAMLNKLSRT